MINNLQALLENFAPAATNSKPPTPLRESMVERRINIEDRRHVVAINSYKARTIAHNAQKQRVHRSLQLAKHTEFATVVCGETGIVSILEIPAIKGFALVYNHPVADLANARGLAGQGKVYLRSLDTQVLAGILIVLTSDYSLFVYQPSDSGAQKNAILRTIQKETLINAILTVEDMIHSSNHSYLPRLSLIFDTEIENGGFENRMQAWLKLIVEAIYKPDTEVWDEYETVQRVRDANAKKHKLIKKASESIERKNQKVLKDDCKLALGLIKDLYKQELISSKLRIFLGGIFQEYQLITMEPGARILLTGKLQDIGNSDSAKLSEILNRNRGNMIAKNTPMDDFFADSPSIHSEPVAAKVTVKATIIEPTVKVHSIEATVSVEAGQQKIQVAGKDFIVSEVFYRALSFLERVKYNKALLAGTAQ